jgi:shikimate dehydrogenase
MQLYVVAGKPVFHSRSPEIFKTIFSKYRIDANYLPFAAFSAKEVLDVAKTIGILGINVTSPFKEEILEFVEEREELVEEIGAANTILISDGKALALNTDVYGVRKSFEKNRVRVEGKNVGILGAGGAARAVAFAISSLARPVFFNRTLARAQKLAEKYGGTAFSLLEKEKIRDMDIVISCLPPEIGSDYAGLLRKGQILLDANYSGGNRKKEILTSMGVRYIDGREWLIFQAIYAAKHFFNIEPPYEALSKSAYGKRKRNLKICVVGFMGSGKTSVGGLLAKKMGMDFIDTDGIIEEKEKSSIERIFREKGEAYFRQIEEELVVNLLESKKRAVISLGGGSVLSKRVRESLRKHAVTIWLFAKKETILRRTETERSRPLLKKESLDTLIEHRTPIYARVSDLLISTENKDPETIADRLKMEIEHGVNSD